jgi:hypothetical protein
MDDWRPFLERYSYQLLASDDSRQKVPDEVRRAGWMGYAPATNSAIHTTEQRLGRTLPPSLRSFYAVSNGWRQTRFFIYNVLPVEELGWLADKKPHLYEMVCQTEQEPGPFEDDPGGVRLTEYRDEQGTRVKRSLVISSLGDAATWLLDPGAEPYAGEWPGGGWASWNPAMEWSARSFAELMEQELASFVELRNKKSG